MTRRKPPRDPDRSMESMQNDTGLKRLLTFSFLYDALQTIAGARRAKTMLAANFWKVEPGERLIDVGCGTGDIADYIHAGVDLIGFDVSEKYIETARKRYGARGRFLVGGAADVYDEIGRGTADIVTCNGVLHHLDEDRIAEVFEFAVKVLEPDGRMICVEPCFTPDQSRVSRWLMKQDRGQGIRDREGWTEVTRGFFPKTELTIVSGLVRIPYVHVMITGSFS